MTFCNSLNFLTPILLHLINKKNISLRRVFKLYFFKVTIKNKFGSKWGSDKNLQIFHHNKCVILIYHYFDSSLN